VIQQVELLEDEADPGRPDRGQSGVGQRRYVLPADPDLAAVPPFQGPATCSRVLLPDPDGPMTATRSAGWTSSAIPVSAVTGGAPG
jgi:hypothetical protein